jgi:hypothetical protein
MTYAWFFGTIYDEGVNKSYVFLRTCAAVCVDENVDPGRRHTEV